MQKFKCPQSSWPELHCGMSWKTWIQHAAQQAAVRAFYYYSRKLWSCSCSGLFSTWDRSEDDWVSKQHHLVCFYFASKFHPETSCLLRLFVIFLLVEKWVKMRLSRAGVKRWPNFFRYIDWYDLLKLPRDEQTAQDSAGFITLNICLFSTPSLFSINSFLLKKKKEKNIYKYYQQESYWGMTLNCTEVTRLYFSPISSLVELSCQPVVLMWKSEWEINNPEEEIKMSRQCLFNKWRLLLEEQLYLSLSLPHQGS